MLEIVYELALVLSKLRRNVPMPRGDVTIKTRDGNCPASVFTPANGKGPWPAVIFYMDGLGIRPVMWEMGQRLADGGYLVLQPDLYYRFGSYPPKVASEVLGNPKSMEELMKWLTASIAIARSRTPAHSSISFHRGPMSKESDSA